MNLYQINNAIKEISLSKNFIAEYAEGDVYDYLNSGEHRYAVVFLTIRSVSSVGDQWSINANLFYIDRLLQNNTNKLEIQSIAVDALKSIFNELEEQYPEVTISNDSYIPFTEKFSDLCAGVYSDVNISFAKENICE